MLVALALLGGGDAAAQVGGAAVISGYVRTADFDSAEGARVRVRGGGGEAFAGVSGRFALPAWPSTDRRVEVEVLLEGYFPAVVEVRRVEGALPPVVLIPRSWTIRTGRYAGETVAIDLAGAAGVGCGGCGAFYAEVLGDERSGVPPGIPAWPPTAFPLQVGFDPDPGAVVSPRDSLLFWSAVESVEQHFGLRLFRPATRAQALAEAAPGGSGSLLVILDPTLPSTGWGSSMSRSGDILAGSIHFRGARTFSLPDGERIVAHELVHALGFGHTCRWRSIVADTRRCRGNQAPGPTASDVAHVQLLWRIRELERGARASTTIAAALRAYPLESH